MDLGRFLQAIIGNASAGLLLFGAGAVAARDTQALEPVWFACVLALFLGFLLGAFVLQVKAAELALHAVYLATPLWFLWGYGGLPHFALLVSVPVLFWGAYGAVVVIYPLLRSRRGDKLA
jgi:hypothetical protein